VAAVGAGLLAGCGGGERAQPTPEPRRHLTAQEICVVPQPVPCDLIDELPPDKRAALERDALRYLDGRTVEQAIREREARREQDAAEARAGAPPPDDGYDDSIGEGEITNFPVKVADFKPANTWLAPERVAGSKNSIMVSVGSSIKDPAQGLVFRSAYGDTVVKSTTGTGPRPADPLPGRGRGAHIKSANNRTGILTIAFANGRTLLYDGVHGKVVHRRR
jgi:hypothetical protein